MTLVERTMAAMEKDPGVVLSRKDLNKSYGFTTEYMESLGLSKSDLKKLARKGHVLRGYTQNVWLAGETLPGPGGEVVPVGQRYVGKGSRARWALIAETTGAGNE